MNKTGIAIPVRMASTRLPNKPLLEISGLPMIAHVWNRAILAAGNDQVVIATPDQIIKEYMESLGARVFLSRENHENGTSRIAELSKYIEWENYVVLQGDEPLILPSTLEMLIQACERVQNRFINTISKIENVSDIEDESVVKCAINNSNQVMFFFRKNPLINNAKLSENMLYKVNGLFSVDNKILQNLKKLPIGKLESSQSIEQFRLLENKLLVDTLIVPSSFSSVNTKKELEKVISLMETNKQQSNILSQYAKK